MTAAALRKVPVRVGFRPEFGDECRSLERDLRQAIAAGEEGLDVFFAAFPLRLRDMAQRGFTLHVVRAQGPDGGAAGAPAAAGAPSAGGVVAAVSSPVDGAPAGRPGRPVGSVECAVPALEALRLAKGWSREKLAAEALAAGFGISVSTLGALERGECAVRLRHKRIYSAVFGLEMRELERRLALPAFESGRGHFVEI